MFRGYELAVVDDGSANKLKMGLRRWKIYRRIEDLVFFAAAYYFCHYTVSEALKHYWF